jgi:hypothetical protein
MIGKGIGVMLAGLVLASSAAAQAPAWQFRWRQGQALVHAVEQQTTVTETAGETESTRVSKLALRKRWQVAEVDAAGVATLQLSVLALRLETTLPGGETIFYDSANPDKSDPQMREQLAQYVGATLAVLRVDGRGRVVEVKESKHGPASRYESDPPFAVVLPERAPQPGQGWERGYAITLEPPEGVGEKFDAVQRYTCQAVNGPLAVVNLTTTVKAPPESPADQVPLLAFQPQGEVVFDLQHGILRRATHRIDKEVSGHQGAGSSYRYQSTYKEEYVGSQ